MRRSNKADFEIRSRIVYPDNIVSAVHGFVTEQVGSSEPDVIPGVSRDRRLQIADNKTFLARGAADEVHRPSNGVTCVQSRRRFVQPKPYRLTVIVVFDGIPEVYAGRRSGGQGNFRGTAPGNSARGAAFGNRSSDFHRDPGVGIGIEYHEVHQSIRRLAALCRPQPIRRVRSDFLQFACRSKSQRCRIVRRRRVRAVGKAHFSHTVPSAVMSARQGQRAAAVNVIGNIVTETAQIDYADRRGIGQSV